MRMALLMGIAAAGLSYGRGLVVVEPLGLTGRVAAPPAIAVVGGEPVKFDLAVEAPAGAKVSLLADIRQVAKDLVAPLQTNVSLGGELNFTAAERRMVTVDLALPEVKQPTMLLVDFKTTAEGPAAGQAVFLVFPRIVPGQLARTLAAAEKSGGLRLALFGKSPALRAFFRDQKITFQDLGDEFPEEFASGQLVLGEVTAADLEAHRPAGTSGRAILFATGTRLPPGVYQTVTPGGCLTKVTLPLPSGLADNPQSRNLFLDLVNQQLNPAASAVTP